MKWNAGPGNSEERTGDNLAAGGTQAMREAARVLPVTRAEI